MTEIKARRIANRHVCLGSPISETECEMLCTLSENWIRWTVLPISTVILTAMGGFSAEAGEQSAKARQIYDLVMAQLTDYETLNEPKVMAICIDWDAPTSAGFYIHNAFVTYTDEGTDVPVFIGRLANDAKSRCKRWRKTEKIDCKCQILDMNGKNALKVPKGE